MFIPAGCPMSRFLTWDSYPLPRHRLDIPNCGLHATDKSASAHVAMQPPFEKCLRLISSSVWTIERLPLALDGS